MGMKVAIYLGSLVQLHCGEWGTQIALVCVGSDRSGWTTLDFPLPKAACSFWVYITQSPGFSARALSKVGPEFHPHPRSKPLRFSVLHKGMDPDGLYLLCSSQVWKAQATWCSVSALSQIYHASWSPPQSGPPGFPGILQQHSPRCAVCLLWGADLSLWHSWHVSTIQDPGKTCLATWTLLTFWWKMRSLEPSCSGCHMRTSLGRDLGGRGQLALLWYSLNPLFFEYTRGHRVALELFMGKVFITFYFILFYLFIYLFLSLWWSHGLGCYLTVILSDFPQDIQAQSLP